MEIKGQLTFKGSDQIMLRAEMEQHPELRSSRTVVFSKSVIPADYEPDKYDLTGEYVFKVVCKPKTKK